MTSTVPPTTAPKARSCGRGDFDLINWLPVSLRRSALCGWRGRTNAQCESRSAAFGLGPRGICAASQQFAGNPFSRGKLSSRRVTDAIASVGGNWIRRRGLGPARPLFQRRRFPRWRRGSPPRHELTPRLAELLLPRTVYRVSWRVRARKKPYNAIDRTTDLPRRFTPWTCGSPVRWPRRSAGTCPGWNVGAELCDSTVTSPVESRVAAS